MEGQEIHDTSLEQGGAIQNWNEFRIFQIPIQ